MHPIKAGLPIIAFASPTAWEAWLAAQPADSKGLWLKLARKAADVAGLTREQALDGALRHGWIDGQGDKFDERHWLIRFTPRRPRSRWSQINRDNASKLIASGRMQAAGLLQVELAKADGRWDAAYAPQSTAAVPDDLRTALANSPKARTFFETLDRLNRYAILHRIHAVKLAETRARRIVKYIAMLESGETIHPLKAQPKTRGARSKKPAS